MVYGRDNKNKQCAKLRCLKCINFLTSFGICLIEDLDKFNDFMHINYLNTSSNRAPSEGLVVLIKRLQRPFAL